MDLLVTVAQFDHSRKKEKLSQNNDYVSHNITEYLKITTWPTALSHYF